MKRTAILCFITTSCLTLISAIAVLCQSTVTLPVLTYLRDGERGVRPLVGIPEAAIVGASIDVGVDLASATISPNRDYMIATTSDGHWALLLQFRTNSIAIRALSGTVSLISQSDCADIVAATTTNPRKLTSCRPQPVQMPRLAIDRMAMSPSGSAFALYSETESRIYAFADGARASSSTASFDVANLGSFTAFAISDDGQTVALGVSDGTEGAIYLLRAQQAPLLAASIGHPSVIQFFRASGEPVVADDNANAIYAFPGGQISQIAEAGDGISSPIGIGVSNDNERVFVANGTSQSITTISMKERRAQLLECHCRPTGLYATSSDSIFRLTDYSGGPVLLFDGNPSEPRLIFVPAGSPF